VEDSSFSEVDPSKDPVIIIPYQATVLNNFATATAHNLAKVKEPSLPT
jgi:hypothetical protein